MKFYVTLILTVVFSTTTFAQATLDDMFVPLTTCTVDGSAQYTFYLSLVGMDQDPENIAGQLLYQELDESGEVGTTFEGNVIYPGLHAKMWEKSGVEYVTYTGMIYAGIGPAQFKVDLPYVVGTYSVEFDFIVIDPSGIIKDKLPATCEVVDMF